MSVAAGRAPSLSLLFPSGLITSYSLLQRQWTGMSTNAHNYCGRGRHPWNPRIAPTLATQANEWPRHFCRDRLGEETKKARQPINGSSVFLVVSWLKEEFSHATLRLVKYVIKSTHYRPSQDVSVSTVASKRLSTKRRTENTVKIQRPFLLVVAGQSRQSTKHKRRFGDKPPNRAQKAWGRSEAWEPACKSR